MKSEPSVPPEKLFGPKVDVCKVEKPNGVRRLRPNPPAVNQGQSALGGTLEKMLGSRVDEDQGSTTQKGSSLFSTVPSRSLTITPETASHSSFSAHVKKRNVDEVKRITDR